jgi:hypothetical protein
MTRPGATGGSFQNGKSRLTGQILGVRAPQDSPATPDGVVKPLEDCCVLQGGQSSAPAVLYIREDPGEEVA